MFYVIIGVSGSGKTTVGQILADQLNIPFSDADDFHSSANKTKMNRGIPLTDEDRLPWLILIHDHIKRFVKAGEEGVVTCSALKKKYRKTILMGNSTTATGTIQSLENDVTFIYLKGTTSVIRDRLIKRTNHFMPVELLDSQISTMEDPDDEEHHVVVDIDNSIENIIHKLIVVLR